MGRWFGTDGVRDVAGEGLLAPDAVLRMGRALADFAAGPVGGRAHIALGRDSRSSGAGLLDDLAHAMRTQGARVRSAGLLPTPALAWWVAVDRLDLGVSVSASHNPEPYNGLKPFAAGGRKLEEAEEKAIETRLDTVRAPDAPRALLTEEPIAARYVEACAHALGGGEALRGRRLCVDLAAGAASATAVPLLRALGADVLALNPAGERPINQDCGSEHPAAWQRAVCAERRIGLAFDGDADRILLADDGGHILDGDDLLGLLALDLKRRGELRGGAVVSTVMSNMGLELWLREQGIALVRTAVGDRHVAAAMRARGAPVGGEPSGHIVLAHPAASGALIGDAVVAGISALEACDRLGVSLRDVGGFWQRFPQRLVNLRLPVRRELADWPALRGAIAHEEAALAGRGRILVRWSGTEPVLRLMAEAREAALVDAALERLSAVALRGG